MFWKSIREMVVWSIECRPSLIDSRECSCCSTVQLSMEDDDIRLPDGYQARVKGIWYVLVPLYYRKYRYVSHAYKTWIQISIIVVYTILSVFITQICFIMTLRYADMFGSSGIRATTASHQRPLVADFRMPLGAETQGSNLQITRVLGPELHGRPLQIDWRYMF